MMSRWSFKRKHFLLGTLIGFLMTIGCLVFFLMYTSFVSLFQSLNPSHVYASQLAHLKVIGTYVALIRICFFGSLISLVFYIIHSLIGYYRSRHQIYIWTLILGMVSLILLALSFNFMVELHSLSIVKNNDISSLISTSHSFFSLFSGGLFCTLSGLLGMAIIAMHCIYLLEITGQVTFESDDLKVPFYKIERLLKADEKMDMPQKEHRRLAPSSPRAKTIEFTSYKNVPHYYEKRPQFNVAAKPKKHITPLQKAIVVVLVCVAVLLAGMGAYTTYDKFFNENNLDLMSGVSFNFAGESGSGYITNFDNDVTYDRDNDHMQDFMNHVRFDYDHRRNLSNGDEVTITARYSHALAKKYKIHVMRNSKSYKVSGLVYRFVNGKKIKKSIRKAIEKDADAAFKNYFEEKRGNNPGYSYVRHSYWFGKNRDAQTGDYAVGVYRVTYRYSKLSSLSDNVNYYMYCYVGGVNSNYQFVKSSANYRIPENRIYAVSPEFDTQKIHNALMTDFPKIQFSRID